VYRYSVRQIRNEAHAFPHDIIVVILAFSVSVVVVAADQTEIDRLGQHGQKTLSFPRTLTLARSVVVVDDIWYSIGLLYVVPKSTHLTTAPKTGTGNVDGEYTTPVTGITINTVAARHTIQLSITFFEQ